MEAFVRYVVSIVPNNANIAADVSQWERALAGVASECTTRQPVASHGLLNTFNASVCQELSMDKLGSKRPPWITIPLLGLAPSEISQPMYLR